MAMRQWPMFSSTEVSCRDGMQEDMVAIHQPVLKSTTRAGLLRWFFWFVSFVWLEKNNQMNQTDEIEQIDSALPLNLALMYSHVEMRGERP
jgi:hypothetical protein